MTTGNYNSVGGVTIEVWEGDEDEPSDVMEAEVEEMYVRRGRLVLTLTVGGKGLLYDISVPILARSAWNQFVDSLPRWGNTSGRF